jgi:hypothetical protein
LYKNIFFKNKIKKEKIKMTQKIKFSMKKVNDLFVATQQPTRNFNVKRASKYYRQSESHKYGAELPFFITLRDDSSTDIFRPAFMRGRLARRSCLQVSYLLLIILKTFFSYKHTVSYSYFGPK